MARMDYEKRRRKQLVDERGPLPWWRPKWKPTVYPDATAPITSARSQDPRRAAPEKHRALITQLQARIAELQRDRDGGNDASGPGFVKGATFTYRNTRGDLSKHTIVRVARARVYTHDGKQFKVRTLRKLSQGRNPIVELL
jgi:hypothetical protein